MTCRSLKTNHPYIEFGQEINGISDAGRPTLFRALLFQKLEYSNPDHEDYLKGEDVVAFYHKHFSAYLTYDSDLDEVPFYYASSRISVKSRKKSSWMWKIESCNLNQAAGLCATGHTCFYRIKHVVSNMYLVQRDSEIAITADYQDAGTLFSFKHFSKKADADVIRNTDMIFIRGYEGDWLMLAESDNDDDHRTMPIAFKALEMVPDSDALLIMPIRPTALSAVVKVRRLVLVLTDFQKQLADLPDCTPASLGSERGARAVLSIVLESYDRLYDALRTLVVNCSWGENPDPMSRDGIPNKYLQKLLRELGVINQVVEILQIPFNKGVDLDHAFVGAQKASHEKLLVLINLMHRLLKQIVKENMRNSKILYKHLGALRRHLGKGILATPTIREVFAGKRELLNLVNDDLIDNFVDLLKKDKAPQYIDFLMSICTCPEPFAQVQAMIADRLLDKHPELLPNVRIESKGGYLQMKFNVPGIKDEDTDGNLWLDMSDYKATKEVRGRQQDYVGWIMNATLSELSQKEKLVRYFIRCSNLYGKLAAGRNQAALKSLIGSPVLALSYQQILSVCKETKLPYLLRARYLTLMSKLFVDRDPQSATPQIMFTRVWSKVTPETSDLNMAPTQAQSNIPVCTTGFKDLQEFLLSELSNCADCRDDRGKPSLNGEPRIGQLEMVSAMILLVDQLVGYGFFIGAQSNGSTGNNKERDNTQINQIFGALFRVLDTRVSTVEESGSTSLDVSTSDLGKQHKATPQAPEMQASNGRRSESVTGRTGSIVMRNSSVTNLSVKSRASDKSVESRFRNDLRCDALSLLLRLFNLRLDTRITFIISVWEDIFANIESSSGGLGRLHVAPQILSNVGSSAFPSRIGSQKSAHMSMETRIQNLKDTFAEFNDQIKKVLSHTFETNIVSSPEIGSDVYKPYSYIDTTVEVMLDLCTFKHAAMTKTALSLLIRNMSQRVSCFNALGQIQILVYPAAVKVYTEATFSIKRLSGLHKLINADKIEAYEETVQLLGRLTSYIVQSPSNKREIVQKNQSIMLNLDLDSVVRNLLSLHFGRDTSRRDSGILEADIPLNLKRRDLFQACYTFLKQLCHKFPKAQEKLFPHIKIFKGLFGFVTREFQPL